MCGEKGAYHGDRKRDLDVRRVRDRADVVAEKAADVRRHRRLPMHTAIAAVRSQFHRLHRHSCWLPLEFAE